MSETNKANTVAFHKKAVFEGDVENAFRMYAGAVYRQRALRKACLPFSEMACSLALRSLASIACWQGRSTAGPFH